MSELPRITSDILARAPRSAVPVTAAAYAAAKTAFLTA